MYVTARKIEFLDDVKVNITYQDGKIIYFDFSTMFTKYPQLEELRRNRKLFLNGKLDGLGDGIIWNDELDFSTASVYECGELVGYKEPSINEKLGAFIQEIMWKKGLTQTDIEEKSHIDQADVWRLINGEGNPTLKKIDKICKALDIDLQFSYKKRSKSSYKSKATN